MKKTHKYLIFKSNSSIIEEVRAESPRDAIRFYFDSSMFELVSVEETDKKIEAVFRYYKGDTKIKVIQVEEMTPEQFLSQTKPPCIGAKNVKRTVKTWYQVRIYNESGTSFAERDYDNLDRAIIRAEQLSDAKVIKRVIGITEYYSHLTVDGYCPTPQYQEERKHLDGDGEVIFYEEASANLKDVRQMY